jgi:putative transposase
VKRSRFDATQILEILRLAQRGVPVLDICARYDISPATFFRWKRRYQASEQQLVDRLRDLESANAQMRSRIENLVRDIDALRMLVRKEF